MAHKTRRQKWIDTLNAYLGRREGICPNCGGNKFKDAYLELNEKENIGWGAFWCENCRQAFVLSRVILKAEEVRAKIVPALPDDLKFV